MGVDTEEVQEMTCNRGNWFEENVYVSKIEMTMPIVMKVRVVDYIRKKIIVNVIDREVDLFCGLKTLQE